jgi:alkanesulfonate monooxygenase SsuD/methylene tetrahydromethanopterin reductase-like flavin-dependent oxidoreductase (luciferase family)
MDIGLFCPTFHPPARTVKASTAWDLEILRWADELGFSEAWLGEHYTLGWEPLPAPDLLIATALAQTERIRLGPAAHLLPYHHPVELATRIAWLDQLAEGRYMVAFGAGSYRSDQQLFVTGGPQANAAMAQEAQEVMLGLWRAWSRGEGFVHAGPHYRVDSPAFDEGIAGPHLRPWRGERPEVAVVGASPGSVSLRRAGAQGFIPMTVVHSRDYASTHWDVYAAGAQAAGRPADRSVWRVSHPLFVADTDAEARERGLGGAMGDTYRSWILPHADRMGTLAHFAPALAATGPVTVERLADGWLMGSPETVAEGIVTLFADVGGFGTLLVTVYDYADDRAAYRRSLELLATEVLPRVNARLNAVTAV